VSKNLENRHLLTRREFTLESALAMLAGVTITVSGCGGGSSSNPAGPTLNPGDEGGSISANHGHIATILAAEITAAGPLSLNIRGQATHPHTVTLTASQVQQIGAQQRVSVISTNEDAHDHTVTFN
jgi:hypothetical protein